MREEVGYEDAPASSNNCLVVEDGGGGEVRGCRQGHSQTDKG